ncbi:hypothetical protein PVAP13_3NG254656 [Panicum virgatum]|uniref:Uncharacterized protein n=1 Tax=Panicum virgatum TaxID=38727 RepID=A0A8T0UHT8_PANVG|nr:hypothetical protein PVAP13_3NG254656 [Panicum virgatum]
MGNAISAAAAALWAAITAVELVNILDPHSGAQSLQPPHGKVRDLLMLAATGGLFTAATFIYRQVRRVHRAGGAGNGADNRRLSDLFALLCASAGALEFFIFVQPASGSGTDAGEQARALGLAALRALPAAATATFFLAMMLIVVRHIRAGGEGGGGVVAAGQAPVGLLLLTKMALAATVALVFLMAGALYGAQPIEGPKERPEGGE